MNIREIKEQFFGRAFVSGLSIITVLFLIAIAAYAGEVSGFILFAVAIIVAIVTAKNPFLGMCAVFLELFSNSHGHLFFAETPFLNVSLRMVVFLGFFSGYLVYLLGSKQFPRGVLRVAPAFVLLALAVLLGFVQGFREQNPAVVFQDGNAYIYLLYVIPFFAVQLTAVQKKTLLQILAAGAVWNVILSLVILYVFSHVGEGLLRMSYVFLRDIRLAEITDLGGGVYRVFIQSQFFAIAFGVLFLAFLFFGGGRTERLPAMSVLVGIWAVVLLSLSRSFWIGLIVAAVILLFLVWYSRRREACWSILYIHVAVSAVCAVLLIALVVLFPIPSQRIGGNELADALRARTESDVAVSSRWALLDPMREKIVERPVLGHGFGTAVSFISDDPRVRELNPDGRWSTHAMEWGWLELWLKMGILGPVGFFVVFSVIIRYTLIQSKTDQGWVGIGLCAAVVFLYATHFFSPYLNHPIGLGFILFSFLFLTDVNEKEKIARSLQEMPVRSSAAVLPAESS